MAKSKKRGGVGIVRSEHVACLMPIEKAPKTHRGRCKMLAQFLDQSKEAERLEKLTKNLFGVMYYPGDRAYVAITNIDSHDLNVDLQIPETGRGTLATRMAKEMRRVAKWYRTQAAALEKADRAKRRAKR